MNQRCDCAKRPNAFFNDNADAAEFAQKLAFIEQKQSGWINLTRCNVCNQYWQVDIHDKGHTGVIIKINDNSGWKAFSDEGIRRVLTIAYLEKYYEGTIDSPCGRSGCSKKRLKKLAYCPDCAYDYAKLRR